MLRARRAEDKEQRRRSFLNAVKFLFDSGSFASVTMADVARQAGLAKGTVFLYFPTKEALFLELVEEESHNWLDEMDKAFAPPQEKLSPEDVAAIISDSLARRSALTRTLTLVQGVLEHNVAPERVLEFKLNLFRRMEHTGTLLERHVGREGSGVHLFLRIYALVIGLRTLTDRGPVAREAMQHEELSGYVLDFNTELRAILLALFRA
jgi:AcrR family transcriptional regulator